jgi:ornithine decarboxylase
MTSQSIFPESPEQWLTHETPDDPVYFFYPDRLAATAARFQAGFPGLVTYAVKANPETEVMEVLVASGLTAFDVASVQEMRAARWVSPKSKLNYHNPVRSVSEIEAAHAFGIASWSIDRPSELEKIGDVSGQEISVRLKLPVSGGIYDFGEKFGAPPGLVSHLLKEVVARGGTPSITFHPGTQCHDPDAWARYIAAAAKAAKGAGVRLGRLNVGGGFPAQRGAHPVQLEVIFDTIAKAVKDSFGVDAPDLVCEPGRAMVADAYDLLVRIKALSDGQIYLNDGI